LRQNILLRFLWYIGGILIFGCLFGIAVITYFSFGLPKIASLEDYNPPIPSRILARDGTVLTEIGKEKRQIVEFKNIPKLVVNAFLSAEDDAFFDHHGVDYWGVVRAMLMNIKAGRVVQGGSTITQQVAKSLLLSRERSISRKIKDFLLALKIEEKLSKEDILFLYLNQVYLGGGYYGVSAAVEGYFGKTLAEVTVAEASMIAGLLVAPGKYSPYINPTYAIKRQRYVLGRMLATAKITQQEHDDALKESIKYRIRKKSDFLSGYFTDWIRQRVIDLVGEDNFLENGFTVKTTLDYQIQKEAEKAIQRGVKQIDKRQGYSGPTKTLENLPEVIEEYEKNFRKEIYDEESTYFTVDAEGKKVFEFELDAEAYNPTKEKIYDFIKEYPKSEFVSGIREKDEFQKLLKEEQQYRALVIRVQDDQRLIYVSLGGLIGIIPYDNFKWAHVREISEDRKFFPYVTKPSSILKPGDVIYVTLEKKNVKIEPYLYKTFISKLTQLKEFDKVIKKENYLLCSLDQIPEVQAALVSIQPETNEIVAFVGGTDFSKSQFNRAIQSLRQPGSSVKPFIYASALENGFTPASIIIDSPEALGGVEEGLNWKPRNYDGNYLGPITFRRSLELSRNIPTIKIADRVGVKKIIEFIQRIGIEAKIDEDLSIALGSFGISLLDNVAAYTVFPGGGKLVDPISILEITDRKGNLYQINEKIREKKLIEKGLIKTAESEVSVESDKAQRSQGNQFKEALVGSQVYDPRLAYVMTNLLKGVIQNGGTGTPAKVLGTFLGGKTGTTSNYVDAWFMGFSSSLVTGVWTGFDDNKTLGWGETGTKSALPIWIDFMREGLRKYPEREFLQPSGIVNVVIDKSTGKLARPNSSDPFMESFVEGSEPGSEIEEKVKDAQTTVKKNLLIEEDEYYENQ